MAINSRAGDYGFAEGAGRESYYGERRARIRERMEFHQSRNTGTGGAPRSVRFIDLEPIEPLQARPVQGEDADPVQAKTFRGNIINIQI
ncbi:MAG TPA: hypothetical protein DDZ83_05860 [Nitrospinae bacterium]|mgnify:CR=1 FL=1|nr:hypothetical protein [Nitrospinota bacterium]